MVGDIWDTSSATILLDLIAGVLLELVVTLLCDWTG